MKKLLKRYLLVGVIYNVICDIVCVFLNRKVSYVDVIRILFHKTYESAGLDTNNIDEKINKHETILEIYLRIAAFIIVTLGWPFAIFVLIKHIFAKNR